MKLLFAVSLAVVVCSISAASGQDTEPSREDIEATKAAILKEGPRVPHDIYQKVVPDYVSRSGKITDKGAAALGEPFTSPASAPPSPPEETTSRHIPLDAPAKSLLKIKETFWTEEFKRDPKKAKEFERLMEAQNPGRSFSVSTKCRSVEHKFLLTPTVSLGKDAEAGESKLHVWVLIEDKDPETKKRKIRVVEPRAFSPPRVTGDISNPVEYGYTEWKCSCCRSLNRKELFMGWYAELRADDKVLATAKSSLLPDKAQQALDEFLAVGSVSGGR
jgi:hypothetical protein